MKHLKFFFIFAVLLTIGTTAFGQNVTISPTTGNLVAALTTGSESGFENGYCALWRHEQLPLSFTVSDFCNITDGGEQRQPAGNITTHGGHLIVDGGSAPDCYMCLSLPKGYRFTGYKIVLANNIVDETINGTKHESTSNKVFYETSDLSLYASTTTMNYSNVSDHNQYNNIVSAIENENPTYLAVAKNANDNYVMSSSNEEGYYTIARESMSDDDMGNHLYFRLSHSNSTGIYGITIISFEVYFTAEGTFDAAINNDLANGAGVARSVVTSAFSTSKIDIGGVERRTKNGKTFFAYSYQNVKDLDAYNWIYQENAVIDGEGNLKHGGEAIEGDEVKTIHPVKVNNQNLLAFGNNTYYVETPVEIQTSQTGLTAPIGYRIVGAVFTPLAGSKTSQGSVTVPSGYKISFTSGWDTYYLRFNGTAVQWSTNDNNNVWIYDSETKGLYYMNGTTRRYLACEGNDNGEGRTLTTAAAAPSSTYGDPGYYDLILFEHDGNTYIGWDSDTPENRYYLRAWRSWWTNYSYVTKNNTQNAVTITVASTQSVELPDFDPGSYTLKVYGTDKNTPAETIAVNGSEEPITLDDLNNDAVKFEISGLDEGKMALLSVTLKLQFLNPYIDKMDVVCHDPGNQLSLSKPFTADDFSVSGGQFVFYIPEDYLDTELTFTFSDLYSKYGDATYNHVTNENPGNCRYSFVKSQHNNAFTDDNIYNNTAEAASSTTETARIDANSMIRTQVSQAGNIRFKFNNAEDLTNTQTNTGTKYLEEYPFSIAAYLASKDPDATTGTTAATGNFIDCKLKASDQTQRSGIYYVFTTDETRYNVAPTTAWQHRYYAFYRMDIELRAKTYTPKLTWTKIYDDGKTYYDNGKTNSQWGLKLQTTDEDEDGNEIIVTGYLTVKEILDAISARTKNDSAAPKQTNQILYVDGSSLYSIINSTVTETTGEGEEATTTTKTLDLAFLKDSLATNAIIFLPENTTSTLDNFAYKTSSGSFRAGKDIVLTDKQPFYTPYDIRVDGANIAKYERLVTNGKNGKVTAASIILPFEILVDDEGAHTNADGTKAFSLHQMLQDGNCLSDTAPEGINVQTDATYAFFPKVEVARTTEPNKPYVVKVLNPSEGNQTSFVVTQKGTLIKATTGMAADYTFTGESASGTSSRGENPSSETYNFTSKGSYSGKKLAKTPVVFYFAQNKFVSSGDLDAAHEFVGLNPFRAVYATGALTSAISSFEIYFGEGNGTPTGINDVTRRIDTGIRAGKGTITIMSAIDNNVKIYTAGGMNYYNIDMQAGETKTVEVPAGIYIVNGVKVIVK
jgi:hypothetical protein